MRRAPAFWRENGLAARLLSPLGAGYGAIARSRLTRTAPRARLPVIAIGGLTAGGDGKTPTAIALAERLLALGERPAFLTRGYGRRARDAPVIVDPRRHDADAVGDEALLLARAAPTFVGANRIESAEQAAGAGATVLVLDDGFHSSRLAPDLTLLAIDSHYGAGNGRSLPAGPLRAPLDAQLAAADMFVVIGDGEQGVDAVRGAGKPVLNARLGLGGASLAGQRVIAFSGIARPEKFHRSLTEAGAEIVACHDFGDHHRFTSQDIADLERLRRQRGARLITTEKDAARLGERARELQVETLPIRLVFDNESLIDEALTRLLCRHPNREA